MVRIKPTRKRRAPDFFSTKDFNHSPPVSKQATSDFIFIAVKTDDDDDGFYLARIKRSDYSPDRQGKTDDFFPIRWLTKQSGRVYRLDYNDKVHPKMVICQVQLDPAGSSKFRLSAEERKRIIGEVEEDDGASSNTSSSEEEQEEPDGDGDQAKATSKARTKTKRKARAASSGPSKKKPKKKETTKRSSARKKFIPNEELVPNKKVQLLKDEGFLSEASTTFVSALVSAKLLIRALLLGDTKFVSEFLSDKSKLPILQVRRSVDMPEDALVVAIRVGDNEALRRIANGFPHRSGRSNFMGHLPFGVSSSQTSERFRRGRRGNRGYRDVSMSRGGREGVDALTQDMDEYNDWSDFDFQHLYADALLRYDVPIDIINLFDQSYGVLDALIREVDELVIHGRRNLAGILAKFNQNSSRYCFNYLHIGALTETDVKVVGAIRTGSVTKKVCPAGGITPIHCAAINPNPDFLREFLRVSPEHSITDKRGRRPVHFAAVCESSGPLKLLLDCGVMYHEADAEGRTPLIYACKMGRTKNAEILLEHAKTQAKTKNSDEGLQNIVFGKFGPCAINKTGRDGRAAIHQAAFNNDLETCKILLKYEANCDLAGGVTRRTALMMAATQGHLEVVKFLIEQANCAVERRDQKKRTALLFAVKNGHAHVTAYLLRLGADPNTSDSSGNRAIHYAAAYGWLECFNLLLTAGADHNSENDWNMTPLAVSFLKGHIGIARKLLTLPGVDVNFRDKNGSTLVILTCQAPLSEQLFEQLKMLVTQMKADVTLKDAHERDALAHLVMSADSVPTANALRIEVAKFLIKSGCSPNNLDAARETPVDCAYRQGRTDLVGFLLDQGGKLNSQLNSSAAGGNFFHHMAETHMNIDHHKMLDQLKRHLPPSTLKQLVNAHNSDGYTPLLMATNVYQDANPNLAHKVDLVDWYQSSFKFMTRLIEDFGADIKTPASLIVRKNAGVGGGDSLISEKSTLVHHLLLPIKHSSGEPEPSPAYDFIRKFQPPLELYDKLGYTPAISVAARGEISTMQLLFELGADLNATSKNPPGPIVTPLLAAAVGKKYEMVKWLISASQRGKQVDLSRTIESTGTSILHLLCIDHGNDPRSAEKRLECLSLLVSASTTKKLDVNMKNKAGRTPLMVAIGFNKRAVDCSCTVETWLLSQGANCTDCADKFGRTALHWLFLAINTLEEKPLLISSDIDPVELLNLLLDCIPETKSVDALDSLQRTPLHYAAASGATVCCLRLLSRGANINAIDANGDSPLSLAVRFQRNSVVLLLIQSKASFFVTVSNDLAADFAQSESELETKVIRREFIEWAPLGLARSGKALGHSERVDLMTTMMKMKWQGLTSMTLLDTVVEANHGALFDLVASAIASTAYNVALSILEKAAKKTHLVDVIRNKINADKRNLLSLLALSATLKTSPSSTVMIKLAEKLVELGCDAVWRDRYGCTSLHYACLNHNKPLVEFFLKALESRRHTGSIADKFGRSPIHALFWNLTDIKAAKRIREILPLINIDKAGMNKAVDFASMMHAKPPGYSNVEFVRFDYFKPYSPATSTCLIRSVESSFYELSSATLHAGADVNCRNTDGLTPLMAAVQSNSVECFIVLLHLLDESVLDAAKPFLVGDRLVINYLKPFTESGHSLTPKKINELLKKPAAKEVPKQTQTSLQFVTFVNGGLVTLGSQPVGSSKSHAADKEAASADSASSPLNSQDDDSLLPLFLPDKVIARIKQNDMPTFKVNEGWQCMINCAHLNRVQMPTNERGVDVLAVEKMSKNTALHFASLSPYRLTLENRFMVAALLKIEPKLGSMKNADGLTAANILKAKKTGSTTTPPHKVNHACSLQSLDIENAVADWLNEKIKTGKTSSSQLKIDEDELKPDSHFASHAVSRIVRHAASGKAFKVAMTKLEPSKSGRGHDFVFYRLELIQMQATGLYVVFTRWGLVRTEGNFQQTPFKNLSDAEAEFCKIFKEKSGKEWDSYLSDEEFVPLPEKYRVVKLDKPDPSTRVMSLEFKLTPGWSQPSSLDSAAYETMKAIIDLTASGFSDGSYLGELNTYRYFGGHVNYFGTYHLTHSILASSEKLAKIKNMLQKITSLQVSPSDSCQSISVLSEAYFREFPRANTAYAEAFPLISFPQNEHSVLSRLEDVQKFVRILIAAEKHSDKNPCDLVLSDIGMDVELVDPASDEGDDVLRFVAASWRDIGPKSGVASVLKLHRPVDAVEQAKLGIENRCLLWLPVKRDDLLLTFYNGVKQSENIAAVVLYTSFKAALPHCDQPTADKPSFMLLCDVGIGQCNTLIDNKGGHYCQNKEAYYNVASSSGSSMLVRPNCRFWATSRADSTVLIHHDDRLVGATQFEAWPIFQISNPKYVTMKYLIEFWNCPGDY